MLLFLIIFSVGVIAVITVREMDIEGVREVKPLNDTKPARIAAKPVFHDTMVAVR